MEGKRDRGRGWRGDFSNSSYDRTRARPTGRFTYVPNVLLLSLSERALSSPVLLFAFVGADFIAGALALGGLLGLCKTEGWGGRSVRTPTN